MKYILPFILVLSLLVAGCSESQKPEYDWSQVPADKLTDLTPVITYEKHQIANPREIRILSNGNILVLDYSSNIFHILSPDFQTLNTFGGEGEGPGEFMSPRQISEINGSLYISDSNTTRISQFTLNGEFQGTFQYESRSVNRRAIALGDSVYVAQTDGAGGYLLRYTNLMLDHEFRFGKVQGGSFSVPDIEKGARQVRAGEIPDFMKREIMLMADEANIYVYNMALSEQYIFDHDGVLADSFKVQLPYLNDLFAMYQGQADPSSSERGFPVLPVIDYIWDISITGNSFWYLTKAGLNIPNQIIRYNQERAPVHIYDFPNGDEYKGVVQLAADEKNEKLYLVNYSTGVVYQTDM